MRRPFHLLEQPGYIIEVEPGSQGAQVACLHSERRFQRPPARPTQRRPKESVHRVLKGLTGSSGLSLELGGHIVFKRQCRAHIMMLTLRHHDVNNAIHLTRRRCSRHILGHSYPMST